ncbi:histidinol-phosphate transaminase [Glycomyces algeriensis]|uniref:Histidinol-phosphate aminotransferase n=1 Tax=Glycomyces algeriensis TaxID=256037 RepID=A0A9W6LGD2_9ACTN|nr:histidinol-phosphate transaminase [Glycomyces algeriensis]MDA1365152.1 histidinol-phosphate transaminase [Glycomyces algeriensis]MDR7349784.1 histidinol-phosphate aminotransferase [Glycomyces algeriensis]GLI42493.1 histidinol-phosphate aminotransferase [Glycomyces algeriensis]
MSTDFTPVRAVAGDGRASEIENLLREDLRGQSPYGAPQLDVPVQLNTNENAFAIPDEVAAVVAEFIGRELRGLNRYPDRDAVALRTDLAAYLGHDLTADHVWAANGSNEILQQLLQAFGGPGRTVLGFMPSYSMHPLLARGTGTAFIDAGREDGYTLSPEYVRDAIAAHDPDLVFLVSPNNPTGTALEPEVIDAAYGAARGIVVIDEAYAEFARDPRSTALGRLAGRKRLVVTRTLSKAFAFAGARVGYLAADPELVEKLLLVRLPYHLSSITQAAARGALACAAQLQAEVDELKHQRDRIVKNLRAKGLPVADSDANFVLVGGLRDAAAVWRAILDRGVLIRDVGLPGRLRITAGTEDETTALLDAFDQALEQRPDMFDLQEQQP